VLSIAVIALTAALFRWLNVPAEVTAALATASGALIPSIAIRIRDRKKSKAGKVEEAVSGTFERPWFYVLLIASGLLTVSEVVWILVEDKIVEAELLAPFVRGLTDRPADANLANSGVWVWLTGIVGLSIALAVAVPSGSYVAHRVKRNDMWCALGAVVLMLVALPFAGVTIEPSESPLPVIVVVAIGVLSVASGVALGVLRGRKTRSLFLAKRLFKGLSESDRSAVLDIMAEAQSAGRLPT
jgi:hypothetical protein